MDPVAASTFLQPRSFLIAFVAAISSLDELCPRAHPHIYALVADEVGIPHALSRRPVKTFADILSVAKCIKFNLDPDTREETLIPNAMQYEDVGHALNSMIKALLRSPDGLKGATELMDMHGDLATYTIYESNGIVSCFLRKICVAFSSLPFDALSRLYYDLQVFTDQTLTATRPSFSPREMLPNAAVTRGAAVRMAKGIAVESEEDFLEWAGLFKRSRGPVMANNMGIQALGSLGKDRSAHPEHPSVEYVMQLEAQRQKNFGVAMDALHRYFDLSIAEIARATVNKEEDGEDKDRQKTETMGHQYAAFSLGLLHAQFGNAEYASVALDDTIRTAQHCSDEACQARALSWIARTCSSVAKRHQMLSHSKDQLALAMEEVWTVFTPVSDEVPDSMNLYAPAGGAKGTGRKYGEGSGQIGAARLSRIQKRISYRNAENRVNALLVSAAAWESHAASPTALSVAKMALSFARREDKGKMSETTARALAAVASLTALEGDYEAASALLKNHLLANDQDHGNRYASMYSTNGPELELLARTLSWLQFERSLRQGTTAAAERLYKTICAHGESAAENSLSLMAEDLMLDALEAETRLQLALRASQRAVKKAEELCRSAASVVRSARVVEGLRLQAEGHLAGGCCDAALPPALAAVSLSQGLGLEAAHVKSMLTLTETMLRMDERDSKRECRAMGVLGRVLVTGMDGLGAGVRAKTLRLHAECLLRKVAREGGEPGRDVVEMIETAEEVYRRIDDVFGMRECAYLLARVLHWRGEVDERELAAKRFLEVDELLTSRMGCLSVDVNN